LFLSGYGVELSDLQSLRTWGSLTPGHPEVNHTPGVEITTGPLGSGLASAVGMAMAQRRQRGLLDPEAAAGESIFDHHIYVLASDGDIMEGVTHEACALAGHQELGNLTVIYDQNQISIEDDTDISFSEDVAARYVAYGWDVRTVDWRGTTADGATYVEDVDALNAAIGAGRAITDKPSLIVLRTIIAWPSPTKQNTGKSHGSALGADEIAGLKTALGFDPEVAFPVAPRVLTQARKVVARGKAAHKAWDRRYAAWRKAQPERAALLDRIVERGLPADLAAALPSWPADAKGIATRAASGKVLSAPGPRHARAVGRVGRPGRVEQHDDGRRAVVHPGPTPDARVEGRPLRPHPALRHPRVRDGRDPQRHRLEGLTRPYGGTFLVFSDYMRGAVRLAAIQQLPVTFVWTHDSIGLGRGRPDPPADRAPGQRCARSRARRRAPGRRQRDRIRLAGDPAQRPGRRRWRCPVRTCPSWTARSTRPPAMSPRAATSSSTAADGRHPEVILVATGSEVAAGPGRPKQLERARIGTRVVSMPCREWFDGAVRRAYRDRCPAADGAGPGVRRGGGRPRVAGHRRRRRADRVDRALRCVGRCRDALPGVRVHPRGDRRRGQASLKTARAGSHPRAEGKA
jgi:transketolase